MARTPASAARRLSPPLNERGWRGPNSSSGMSTKASARATRQSTRSGAKPRLRGPKATSSATVSAKSWSSGKLEGQADALAHASWGLGADVAAVEEHAPARGFEQGVEVLGEGGLARAIGTYEGQYGTDGDVPW